MATADAWAETIARAAARRAGWSWQSAWIPVTQDAIDGYARAVQDPDPMHIDPAWGRANTSYGGTIAQGLWTASMLVHMMHESGLPAELFAELAAPIGLNYGFDRLRLIEPVPVGSSIRGTIRFGSLEPKDERTALLRLAAQVDTDRATRPAVVADWLLAFRKN
jgi:acyl dehydratase